MRSSLYRRWLASLGDGWIEGRGVAPRREHLHWLAHEVAKSFPEALEHPAVVPTEEGHVIFEWMRPHSRIELEFNFEDQELELYATDLQAARFVEESLAFKRWDEAFKRVALLLLS